VLSVCKLMRQLVARIALGVSAENPHRSLLPRRPIGPRRHVAPALPLDPLDPRDRAAPVGRSCLVGRDDCWTDSCGAFHGVKIPDEGTCQGCRYSAKLLAHSDAVDAWPPGMPPQSHQCVGMAVNRPIA
jgi:hypothetical protein